MAVFQPFIILHIQPYLCHRCHLWPLSNFPFLKSNPNSTTYLPFCDLFSNSPAFDLLGGSCKVFDSHLHINDGLYQCLYMNTKQWNKEMVNMLKLVLLASAVGGSSIRWLWASSSLLPGSRSSSRWASNQTKKICKDIQVRWGSGVLWKSWCFVCYFLPFPYKETVRKYQS